MRAAATECWRRRGACRAFACARSLTKLAASLLHLPPVSMPRTTRRHRRLRMSSGYVRSFLRRASVKVVPAILPGSAPWLAISGEGRNYGGVNCYSWAPPQMGRPFAITSMRRSSCLWMWSRFKSVSKELGFGCFADFSQRHAIELCHLDGFHFHCLVLDPWQCQQMPLCHVHPSFVTVFPIPARKQKSPRPCARLHSQCFCPAIRFPNHLLHLPMQ